MTGERSDQMDSWLARPLDEVVEHFRNMVGRPVIVKRTCAPKKSQGPDGTWRVVKVQDQREGIILTTAWQPPAHALGFDAALE